MKENPFTTDYWLQMRGDVPEWVPHIEEEKHSGVSSHAVLMAYIHICCIIAVIHWFIKHR